MWIVIGLGNPGRKYKNSKHNVGFWFIDRLAETFGISVKKRRCLSRVGHGVIAGEEVVLAKPQTFVNLSGEAASRLFDHYKIAPDRLIIAHDDIDIALGKLRWKRGGGHAGHNGVRSIMEHLGSGDFHRIRIGIGRPPPGQDVVDYVLGRFDADAAEIVRGSVEEAVERTVKFIKTGDSS